MADRTRRRAEALFQQAADLPPEERPAFLDQQCAGDHALRSEVESLLECMDDRGVVSINAVDRVDDDEIDRLGRSIGPYRLLRLIGEGGFGSVYLAEQIEPIRRRVALKIIKLGMDTRKVIARFEAERQALALMDHPGIARVLDAGATDTGRPYFVMELVEGVPVTEYCDDQNLSLELRLELFVRVCQAVQHAHLKGIVHRDIKPSNVLVVQKDGVPIPKVIDFGIAKATDRKLSEETFLTDYRYFMGTPEYMSPEQVGGGGPDVDTRTDVYSLGVLLYVLVTSKTPFEWRTLGREAFEELRRVIREVDPPTPSTCVGRLGAEGRNVARHRRLAPLALRRLLRGDLDWIIMKALEKDRNRRYETVADLAQDVRRHLDQEPVAAGPPGTLYRVGKFVRRHRVGVAASCATLLALFAGMSLAAVGYLQAVRARAAAVSSEQEAVDQAAKYAAANTLLKKMLAAADPGVALGREVTMRDLIEQAAEQLEQGSLSGQPEVEASVRSMLAGTYLALGRGSAAERHARAALAIRRELSGEDASETLEAAVLLARALRMQGDYAAAEELTRRTLVTQSRLLGAEHPSTLASTIDLAIALSRLGRHDDAEILCRDTLEVQRRVLGEDHPDTLTSMFQLGTELIYQEDAAESEELLRHCLERYRAIHGERHPDTLKVMNNLALALGSHGSEEAAEALYRETIAVQRAVCGEGHPETQRSLANLTSILYRQGKEQEAIDLTGERIDGLKQAALLPEADALLLNTAAWFLLTCEPPILRDPQAALGIAERAVELSAAKDPNILDTLARAQFLSGQEDLALETQERAVILAHRLKTSSRKGLEFTLASYLLERFDPLGEGKRALSITKKQDLESGKTLSSESEPGEMLLRMAETCPDSQLGRIWREHGQRIREAVTAADGSGQSIED